MVLVLATFAKLDFIVFSGPGCLLCAAPLQCVSHINFNKLCNNSFNFIYPAYSELQRSSPNKKKRRMNISTIFVHVEECALRDNIYLFTCWIIHEYCAQTVLYQTVWILFFHGEFSVDAFWIWILLTTFNAIWFSSLKRTLIWTNAMMLHYSRLWNLAVNPIQIASSMNALLWCLFHFHNRLRGTDHFVGNFPLFYAKFMAIKYADEN